MPRPSGRFLCWPGTCVPEKKHGLHGSYEHNKPSDAPPLQHLVKSHEIPTLWRRRTPRATGTKGLRRPATSPSQGRAGRTSRSEHGAIRVIDNGGLQGLAGGGCLIEAGVDVTVDIGRLTF